MNGVKFFWIKEDGGLHHLPIETAYLPAIGDHIDIRGDEFRVVKRLWTSEVELIKDSPQDFTPPNGYGLMILVEKE